LFFICSDKHLFLPDF